MKQTTSGRRIMAILLSLLLVLGIVAPIAFVLSASATPEELPLTYIGNRANCKMPKEMASGYAGALETAMRNGFTHCEFVDIAGDGMPLMILCRAPFHQESGAHRMSLLPDDLQIWAWNGSFPYLFSHENLYDYDYVFGYHKDIPVLRTNDFQYGSAIGGASYFRIANGNLSLLKSFSIEVGPIYYIDGNEVSEEEHSDDLHYYFTSHHAPFRFGDGYAEINPEPISTCETALAFLREYTGAFSGYTDYPNVSGSMHMVAEEAVIDTAMNDGETCTAIYELIPNRAFYGIIESNGELQGVLVHNAGTDENRKWVVSGRDIPPMTTEQLNQAVYDLKYASNISPDYDLIPTFDSAEDITTYIHDNLLYSVDFNVNDAGINEIILFAETAISSICTKKMYSIGNDLTLGFFLEFTMQKAKAAKKAVEDLLDENNLPRNNPIDVVVPVLWKNCKPEKECRVVLTKNTCNMLADVELRLYLGDNQHFLQFNYDNTDLLYYGNDAEYTFLKGENNTYEVDCEDEYGDSIYHPDLGIGLPAISETSVVIETYEGNTELIGCQYDAASSVLFFKRENNAQYQVVDNFVQIDDITNLPEETQNIIRFLVSGRYMNVDGTNFYPGDSLTRYDFAQALVHMFFAQRTDLTDAFPDVPQDSPYFHCIASGKLENIIEGYDDGLYYGDNLMTVEQTLALASRTLVNKKGYTYPADPASILEKASIDGSVSLWAQEAVSMALRDGLWDYDEYLSPQEPITKEQAALVLYRLFLLLQEVSPLAVNSTTNVLMIAVATIASVAIVICIVLIVILIHKNNQINRRKKGNTNQ